MAAAAGARALTWLLGLRTRWRPAGKSRLTTTTLLGIMLGLFVVTLFANVGIGAVKIPPAQVFSIFLSHLGFDIGAQFETRTDAILWNIRLPRVVLGILVGGGLGIAGASLQGVFRTPLQSRESSEYPAVRLLEPWPQSYWGSPYWAPAESQWWRSCAASPLLPWST